jgi:asparagine synthase (glutamine-hydrolysing)
LVYNGEIYNYIELKKELEGFYKFKTHSDTEVLLASFIKWRYDCVKKFNGMFAFAIYDKEEKELFCARDRIGEKPFVYSEHPTGFYFASELGALYSIGVFSDELDEIGMHYSYLRNFRHIPEPFTKYKQIRRLEPAHAIIVKDKKIIKKWCYWSPNIEYDPNIKEDDVFNIIDDAVRIRERADVQIATLLSGGVDSSIITTLMVKHGLKPKAYTMRFDDEEISRAKYISEYLGIELKILEYHKELQKELYKKMLEIYGEDVRLLPLTHAALLYKEINKDNVKVVMTGIGSDEIFYGYDGEYRQLLFSDIVRFLEVLPKKFLKLFEKIFSFNKDLKLLFELAQIENWKRKGYLYQKEAVTKGYFDYNYNTILDFWTEKVKNAKYYIDISNWLGLITENAHSITITADLPSMMFSIESRAPFLDHRVVELAFKINAHKKVSRKDRKIILKKAFKKLIPEKILCASKKGFGYGIQNNSKEEEKFFNDLNL